MERVEFTNSRNQTLVGHLYSADSEAMIVMAHGFTSDKSSRGRFPQLAEALNAYGYGVLTFDFSGCGESEDERISVDKEVDDLNSAVKYARSKGYQSFALFGNSLGSLVCLKCFTPDIATMVLAGALTDAMEYNWSEYFTAEQMQELAEKGYISEDRIQQGARQTVVIDGQMLTDFETIDQQAVLKNITCPVLIIHGDNNEEEKLLYERSKRAMKLLPTGSKLEVIHGASHGFHEQWDAVISLANDWYLERLPVPDLSDRLNPDTQYSSTPSLPD